jgi:hypothetical protein
METVVLSGISAVSIDRISTSIMPHDYKVFKSAASPERGSANGIVTIRFGERPADYPSWLKALAAIMIILVAIGFIIGVITPTAIAGILFPIGLTGIWFTGKLAKRRNL